MLNWGKNLFGLVIPDGVVHRMRHGATVLWESIYRSVRAALGIKQGFDADVTSLPATNAGGAGEVTLGGEGTANAQPSVCAGLVEHRVFTISAAATNKQVSFTALERAMLGEIKGEVNDPRSTPAAGEYDLLRMQGEVNDPQSVPTAASDAKTVAVHGAANAPQSALAAAAAAETVNLRGAANGSQSAPTVVNAAETVNSQGAAASPDGIAVTAVHPVMALLGSAVNCLAADAIVNHALLKVDAQPRAAEAWVYPRQGSRDMVLDRVAGVTIYEARRGGNGLEVS